MLEQCRRLCFDVLGMFGFVVGCGMCFSKWIVCFPVRTCVFSCPFSAHPRNTVCATARAGPDRRPGRRDGFVGVREGVAARCRAMGWPGSVQPVGLARARDGKKGPLTTTISTIQPCKDLSDSSAKGLATPMPCLFDDAVEGKVDLAPIVYSLKVQD